ncbi:MAG: hypothetical protein V4462_11560 [Pseudomonadota bacterium]
MGHDQTARNERNEAYLRYAARRREARELATISLADITAAAVHLDDITPDAIVQTKEWRHAYPDLRQGSWDWEKIVRLFRRRARHVELAIWVDAVLSGLLVGRISDNRVVATIHFLERRPADNPLAGSVARIATQYLEVLAILLNCRQTALDSPLPALLEFYKNLGYNNATSKGRKVIRLSKTLR